MGRPVGSAPVLERRWASQETFTKAVATAMDERAGTAREGTKQPVSAARLTPAKVSRLTGSPKEVS